MTETEAIAILEALNADGANLTWDSVYEFSDDVAEDDVISQVSDPPPNAAGVIPADAHVILTVSKGPSPTGGGGFPAVSMFGGLLQGANG